MQAEQQPNQQPPTIRERIAALNAAEPATTEDAIRRTVAQLRRRGEYSVMLMEHLGEECDSFCEDTGYSPYNYWHEIMNQLEAEVQGNLKAVTHVKIKHAYRLDYQAAIDGIKERIRPRYSKAEWRCLCSEADYLCIEAALDFWDDQEHAIKARDAAAAAAATAAAAPSTQS